MNQNKLIVIAALAVTLTCFTGNSGAEPPGHNSKASDKFKGNLAEKKIEDISIMVPDYLIEKDVNNGKVFLGAGKGQGVISVLFDNTPLEKDLKNSVSSKYEFWEKTYYPGNSPVFNLWNKLYKSGFKAIEKMEKVDLRGFEGFFIKGIRNAPEGDGVYMYDYILFPRGDKQKHISVSMQSREDYFLTDDECNYIVSTMKASD